METVTTMEMVTTTATVTTRWKAKTPWMSIFKLLRIACCVAQAIAGVAGKVHLVA